MCGICGVYGYHADEPVDQHLLTAMQQAILHRGPDDAGAYTEGPLGLGFRRLSIIDVVGGKQPMTNEDESVVLIFNGEIYNYRELQAQLRQRGHTLQTNSDTEVIVHLYEDEGVQCVHSLRGMFGFALWDKRRQRLLLARDRLGIKPLYYTIKNGTLIFGSEIKALLQHPAVQPAMDHSALNLYLGLRFIPAPATLFRDIYALPPGHILICERGTVRIVNYWHLSFETDPSEQRTIQDYTDELEALLQECVAMHLVSDVPFGAFLSGGVDSSTIVAMMSQFLNEPVKTFSVGFTEPWANHSELAYAEIVAQQYQTDHRNIYISPNDIHNLAAEVIWHLDQPIADEATIANYMVSKLASQHVKMVLTGEGGDELFAGYGRYDWEKRGAWVRRLSPAMRAAVMGMLSMLPETRGPKIAWYALSQSDEAMRLRNWFSLFNSDMQAALLEGSMLAALSRKTPTEMFREHLANCDSSDTLSRMLYVDTKMWLPDDLLARGDKTSMAHSLEARVPLLDHKLVEFAARLPSDLKVRQSERKFILKQTSQRCSLKQLCTGKSRASRCR
ncbi:MAG: asparagine synthase (glutamine-hydrolyzing) [Chloroflexaceae bacterium]|nr:asparagine synthase (glutamine-hydrolyzing) [Chloroflexaceae bacterium]